MIKGNASCALMITQLAARPRDRAPRLGPSLMHPTRALTLAAAGFASISVHAVEYTPAGTTGWWQVQDATTYVELCTASGPPCDIPAGTRVQVIDFGTSPATRSIDTVRNDNHPGALAFKIVTRTEPVPRDDAFSTPFIFVSCPAGQVALSGSCSALGGNDPEFFGVSGVWSGLGRQEARCDYPNDIVLTEPTITVACVNESSISR